MTIEYVQVEQSSQTYEYLKNLMKTGSYGVYDLAVKGYFKCLLPYPSKNEIKPVVKVCECCGKEDVIVSVEHQLKEIRNLYHQEDRRLYELFKKLLFEEFDITGNKAEVVFGKAWECGHASGYCEVVSYFRDYLEFIHDYENARD